MKKTIFLIILLMAMSRAQSNLLDDANSVSTIQNLLKNGDFSLNDCDTNK